jgi:ferric-dicitrate binding protein FerR (iron transport regulator)
VTSSLVLIRKTKRAIVPRLAVCFIHLLALQLVLFTALADARPASGAQEKQPLGSLSSVGQVYVSNAVVPSESTIFTGDALRTGDMATATFTLSGKGSYAIASRSQLVFTGSQQYIAELKSGTVVMSSVNGPAGINLRAGNFVVVAVTQGEQSTSKVDSASDGSFLITSSEGSVGIVPLEGPPNGIFLQPGQSVTISAQGELSAPTTGALINTEPASQPPTVKNNSHTGWIILGVAGGGAAIAGAVLASHKSSPSVSASSL